MEAIAVRLEAIAKPKLSLPALYGALRFADLSCFPAGNTWYQRVESTVEDLEVVYGFHT